MPSWDGNPGSFQEYEESSLLWEQSVAFQKRYLCGPRLAAELTGAARRLVSGRSPDWLSDNDGVKRLMAHLRQCLGKAQIAELTEQLSKFFKGSRRRSGEGINDYISRKNEIYLRVCQALQRVSPHQTSQPSSGSWTAAAAPPSWGSNWTPSRRNSTSSYASENATEAAGDPATGLRRKDRQMPVRLLRLRQDPMAPMVEAGAMETGPSGTADGPVPGGAHHGSGRTRITTTPGVDALSERRMRHRLFQNSCLILFKDGTCFMTQGLAVMNEMWFRPRCREISPWHAWPRSCAASVPCWTMGRRTSAAAPPIRTPGSLATSPKRTRTSRRTTATPSPRTLTTMSRPVG